MLVLSRADVEGLLDLDMLVDSLAAAMADLSAGRASAPSRVGAIVAPRDALLAAMPGYVSSAGALSAKLVSLFPHNRDRPTHQALIAVFDPETGTPLAGMDGTYITATRTAAGSALATRLLSRVDSRVLAILGTGVQARAHARAVSRVRAFDEVRVAGRDRAKTEAAAAELESMLALPVRPAGFDAAFEYADVVCAATHTIEPVVRRDRVAIGMHLNSVGYNVAGREVDAATFRDALVVVESRAAALAPAPSGAPDLLGAIADGVITPEHVHAEIGEVIAGTRPGRTDDSQITLYRSVGVAVQDAAAASLVLAAARAQGAGLEVDI